MGKFIRIIIILVLSAVLLLMAYGFILDKLGQYLYYKDELKPADVIIVVRGEEAENVKYSVKLFNEGWARKDKIIMTDGALVGRFTVASLMKDHALSLGIPKDAILLENKSKLLEEGALYTKDILTKYGYKSCIVVTAQYESKRVNKIFRKIMGDEIRIISAPVDETWFKFDHWWTRSRDGAKVLDEYTKLFWA
jgi:uncharacterized SAM-binding protein YcdF (DUF218 family)